MNKDNIYDIVTISNKEFLVIDVVELEGKKYLLLSEKKQDNYNFDDLLVVELKEEDGILCTEEVKDEKTFMQLQKIFITNLENI